jgi:hypothetical protein
LFSAVREQAGACTPGPYAYEPNDSEREAAERRDLSEIHEI